MKLWKISQTANDGYDTYDSAVVAAETEDEARLMHPDGGALRNSLYDSWVRHPEDVKVEYLAYAVGLDAGIILASFNAG